MTRRSSRGGPSETLSAAPRAALLVLAALSFGVALAQDTTSIAVRRATETPLSNVGLALGEWMPALSAPDQDGNLQSFESIRGPNGAVIYFYRSASWCIYCRAQLVETERAREGLRRNGLGLAGISYDSPEVLKAFADEHGIGFPLLSDPDSQLIRDFQVLDARVLPGNPAYGVPYHGNYIVNHDGVVVATLFDAEATLTHSTGVVVQRLFGSPVNTHEKTITHDRLSLSYFASANTVAPGDELELTIDVRLNDGIHVYAPSAVERIPIAWQLPRNAIFEAGAVAFPTSQRVLDEALGETLDIYTGRFRLSRKVRITAASFDAPGVIDAQGNVVLAGTFDFQACDDRICYLPKSIALEWVFGRVADHEAHAVHHY